MSHPRRTGDFILDADASDHAAGFVLSQIQDGEEKVLAYGSKTFSHQERKYCVTRKELLAVVRGVKRFKKYVYGRHFTVRSDHGSLQWLKNFKAPTGQLARWLETLFVYDFTLITRPGRAHGNADGLSRLPCLGKSGVCTAIIATKEVGCWLTKMYVLSECHVFRLSFRKLK